MTVTLKPKCYASVCVGCEKLFIAERSDALTCSGSCRVRAHRNGSLRRLRELAAAPMFRVPPSGIQHCRAIRLLLPHAGADIASGKRTPDELQPKAIAALLEIVRRGTEAAAP
jgi:hypothetical protein